MVIVVSFARAPAGISNAAPPDTASIPPPGPITALAPSVRCTAPPKVQPAKAPAQRAASMDRLPLLPTSISRLPPKTPPLPPRTGTDADVPRHAPRGGRLR